MVENRGRYLHHINHEWQRLQGVIDTRAADARAYRDLHGEEEAPGMCTGLLVKRVRVTVEQDAPVTTTTYTLDCKTLRELRALERVSAALCFDQQNTSARDALISAAAINRPVSLTLRRSPVEASRRPEPVLKRAA